jgi:hypothetical protein
MTIFRFSDPYGRHFDPQVWITHAGVIRAATLIAQGVRQVRSADQWPRDVLAFGECRVVSHALG